MCTETAEVNAKGAELHVIALLQTSSHGSIFTMWQTWKSSYYISTQRRLKMCVDELTFSEQKGF